MSIQSIKRPQSPYRGRFAPSPSGFLHFGSLITALASFLDARKNQGAWLVRIEDIDPPREKKGASKVILNTLEAFGLHWDEDVLYQSKRSPDYQSVIANLFEKKQSYFCQCTRAQIKAMGGIYQGHCRDLNHTKENSAIKVKNTIGVAEFEDIIQGHMVGDRLIVNEDFTIFRKDGLFAYQLAVVVDDIYQNINHVIRGCDLIEPTFKQLSFYQLLNAQSPIFGHIPLAVTELGFKLSKQNKAPAINIKEPRPLLIAALEFLGQHPPNDLCCSTTEEIIRWAISHWHINRVPNKREINITFSNFNQ